MYLERKQDLSVYYWLQDMFSSSSFINIEDGYPETILSAPTISVEVDEIVPRHFELGNRQRVQFRVWYIDVFGKNKSQRDEYGYRILNELDENISVYDYDEGFPPDVSPTKLGVLEPLDINLKIIKVFPELVEKMYWRATITFSARYITI